MTSVQNSHNSTDWIVSYKRHVPGSFDLDEQLVRATLVILGAGALGSTKILQRSKERGLDVSDEIGKRFSTNGDAVGFSYNGDKMANSLGVQTKNMGSAQPPGPTIASIVDFRKVNKDNFENNIVIEDGTPASTLSELFTVGVSFAAKVTGSDKYPKNEWLEKTFQVIFALQWNHRVNITSPVTFSYIRSSLISLPRRSPRPNFQGSAVVVVASFHCRFFLMRACRVDNLVISRLLPFQTILSLGRKRS